MNILIASREPRPDDGTAELPGAHASVSCGERNGNRPLYDTAQSTIAIRICRIEHGPGAVGPVREERSCGQSTWLDTPLRVHITDGRDEDWHSNV